MFSFVGYGPLWPCSLRGRSCARVLDVLRRHFLTIFSVGPQSIAGRGEPLSSVVGFWGECRELFEEGGRAAPEPGETTTVEVAAVDEVGEAVLPCGDTQITECGVDGIHREPVAGDVCLDVGGYAIVPSRRVVYAAAGVEVSAGGGFVGAHTQPLVGPSRAQMSAMTPCPRCRPGARLSSGAPMGIPLPGSLRSGSSVPAIRLHSFPNDSFGTPDTLIERSGHTAGGCDMAGLWIWSPPLPPEWRRTMWTVVPCDSSEHGG
ncbi:hypothetical protein M2275_002838 [Rhodococcus opacus]|nr:hypothetical protein [Rhodococcus opacus]